jgi:hypothetical protein
MTEMLTRVRRGSINNRCHNNSAIGCYQRFLRLCPGIVKGLAQVLPALATVVVVIGGGGVAGGQVTIEESALPTVLSGPRGITAGPDGNIWFSEADVDQIGRVTPDGVVSEFSVPVTVDELVAAVLSALSGCPA